MKISETNREMQLIIGIGKCILRYIDYIALFFVLPVILNVKFGDTRILIGIGSLIAFRAVMLIIHQAVGLDKQSKGGEVEYFPPHIHRGNGGNGWSSGCHVFQGKKGQGQSFGTYYKPQAPPFKDDDDYKPKAPIEGDTISQVAIHNDEQFRKSEIRFGNTGNKASANGPNQIIAKLIEKDDILLSFSDFRTIRLKKDEVSQLYKALLETEYTFFKPGRWTAWIKVRDDNKHL